MDLFGEPFPFVLWPDGEVAVACAAVCLVWVAGPGFAADDGLGVAFGSDGADVEGGLVAVGAVGFEALAFAEFGEVVHEAEADAGCFGVDVFADVGCDFVEVVADVVDEVEWVLVVGADCSDVDGGVSEFEGDASGEVDHVVCEVEFFVEGVEVDGCG